MSREIKFRDYDMDSKKLRYFDLDRYDRQEHDAWGNVMQYIGLEDRSGTDIYEGDICRILYTDWPSNTDPNVPLDEYLDSISYIGYVSYDAPTYCIMIKDRYGDYGHDRLNVGQHGRITVIGNVHENPQLL